MIKYQNNTISRLYGGNTPAYTLISGGTCVHGEYSNPTTSVTITYTPVEYISNEDSNQFIWFPFDFYWSNSAKCQFKVDYTAKAGGQIIGDYGSSNDSTDVRWFKDRNNTMYFDVMTGRIQSTQSQSMFEVELGNYYVKNLQNNSNIVTGSTYNIQKRTSPFGVFGNTNDRGKIYYVKLYEGDTLVRDLIPVLDSNNTPCFFDKINNNFYYNTKTGTPQYGNLYQQLEYLQGDGSDYVILDYVPSASTVAEIDVEGGLDSTNRYLFGARNRGSSNELLSSVSINQFKTSSFNFLRGTQTYNVSNNTTREVIRHSPDGGYINGEKVATFTEQTSDITPTFALYHCLQYKNGTISIDTGLPNAGYNGKIYSFKVYENDTLVRNYVPAKLGTTKGFYDTILGKFYPSVSNTLTEGSVVSSITFDKTDIYSTDLTTLTYDTPSDIIDTKTNLNASANTGVELIYSSDDTSIATVDSNGQIAPRASGTTTITIIASGTTIGNTTYRGVQKRLEVECEAPSSYVEVIYRQDGDSLHFIDDRGSWAYAKFWVKFIGSGNFRMTYANHGGTLYFNGFMTEEFYQNNPQGNDESLNTYYTNHNNGTVDFEGLPYGIYYARWYVYVYKGIPYYNLSGYFTID